MSSRANAGLFALIIGIDDYTIEVPKLKGAVSDANRFRDWVINDLGVSPARIRNLRNAQATRKAIIYELKDLATNKDIHLDDPILIYYAGHGSEGPAPKEWQWDSPKIQMILPCDYKHPDESNGTIHGIPDRTLGFLLSRLSQSKGNNVTVIFDCCNSGSGTRSESDSRVRGVLYEGSIPADLDEEIFSTGTRGARVLDKFRHHGLRSHILLAACAPHERAHENRNTGDFTGALIKVLSEANTTELTYEGLLERMERLKFQTPQCEGYWRTRILFDKKVPNTKAVLEASLRDGKLIINGAGTIHGIEPGSKFAIWKYRDDLNSPPIATVSADTVGGFASVASFSTKVYGSKFVAQLKGNPKRKLAIHIPHIIQTMACFKQLFDEESGRGPLDINISSRDQATVGLTYLKEDNVIGFEMLGAAERDQVLLHVISPEVEELHRAIEHLSRYYHHRDRINSKQLSFGDKENPTPFSSQFSLEVFKVRCEKEDDDPDGAEMYVLEAPNRNIEGTGLEVFINPAKSEDQPEDAYGFKINNYTKNIDVFPYLFYFNSSDFSISCIYRPEEVTQQGRPPLLRGSSLAIGYGSSGSPPQNLCFSNPALNLELGYLRLYLSTRYVDLSVMEQAEISANTRGMQTSAKKTTPAPIWDCITVPVVIKQGMATTPARMVGILGSKGNGKNTFLRELFESLCGTPDPQPTFQNPYIKEYTIARPKKELFTIVDLPAYEDTNIDNQLATLKASLLYLIPQYQRGGHFVSLIWCYNISKPKFTALDAHNLDLLKDLVGPSAYKNVTVLTTGWNKGASSSGNARRPVAQANPHSVAAVLSPLERYQRSEEQIMNHPQYCKELTDGGASFKRYGVFSDSTPDARAVRAKVEAAVGLEEPLALIQSLLTKEPEVLQVQREACESRTLAMATAGKRLHVKIEEEIEVKKADVEELVVELAGMGEHDNDRIEIEDEKKDAELDILRWGKTLIEIGMVNSALL